MYHELTFYCFLDYSRALSFLLSKQQYAEKKKKALGKLPLRSRVGYVEHTQHRPVTKAHLA